MGSMRMNSSSKVAVTGKGTDRSPYRLVCDATLQDQISDPVILPLVRKVASTTLASSAVLGGNSISVTSATSFAVGQHIRIINSTLDKQYFGTVLGINGTTISLDNLLDINYSQGSQVVVGNKNMAVNGSVTPVIFKLRLGSPSLTDYIEVTRIIFTCTASSAVSLTKFGNLTALTKGILLRLNHTDNYHNIFNLKSNQDLAGIAYDWTIFQASNPTQGVDGFTSRLTFSGQEKMGIALNVKPDENLEMVIQDDLSTLTSLIITVEGHFEEE